MLVIPGIIASANYPRVTSSYESIATVTVGAGGTDTITFSSIPSTYKHLQLRTFYIGTGTYDYLRVNSDTGSNYLFHQMWGDGSSVQAGGLASTDRIYLNNSSSNASYPSVGIMDLLDYQNTNKYKTVRSLAGYDFNGGGEIYFRSGAWLNTSAVTTLTITSSTTNGFNQNSVFALYGVKG